MLDHLSVALRDAYESAACNDEPFVSVSYADLFRIRAVIWTLAEDASRAAAAEDWQAQRARILAGEENPFT